MAVAKKRAAIGAWAILLAVAGCSSPGSGQSGPTNLPEPTIPANVPPAPADPASVHLPLAPYLVHAKDQDETVAKASRILVQSCMRAKGFNYSPDQDQNDWAETQKQIDALTGARDPNKDPVAPPAYGINDLDQARRSGYTTPGQVSVQRAAEHGVKLPTPDDQVRKYGQAWFQALYGFVPPATEGHGGCDEASEKLYVEQWKRLDKELPGRLSAQASELAQGDSRVVPVLADWSRCMAEQGYHYKTPMEPPRTNWPLPPGPTEIATAVADVTCKQRTNLPGIWLAVEAGYQQALLERNAPALKELNDAWQQVVKAAEEVIAKGG